MEPENVDNVIARVRAYWKFQTVQYPSLQLPQSVRGNILMKSKPGNTSLNRIYPALPSSRSGRGEGA